MENNNNENFEIAKEIYDVLDYLLSLNGDYAHWKHDGFINFLTTGKSLNKAIDVLYKYKDMFKK